MKQYYQTQSVFISYWGIYGFTLHTVVWRRLLVNLVNDTLINGAGPAAAQLV